MLMRSLAKHVAVPQRGYKRAGPYEFLSLDFALAGAVNNFFV